MILSDKIINLRKKAGWSQEELASQLGVSRQSVSKWESAQSVPDMNKILKMSQVFHVSTDYLLKDDLEEPGEAQSSEPDETVGAGGEVLTPVSMEDANHYLSIKEKGATQIALGVALCILSPILAILLSALGEAGYVPFNEDQGAIMGAILLIVMVAAAVMVFVKSGLEASKYSYIEEKDLDTEYGVEGMARDRMEKYHPTFVFHLSLGIVLCVLSAIPVMFTEIFASGSGEDTPAGVVMTAVSVCLLLALIAIGVYLIVQSSIITGSYKALLEEGDYSRESKHLSKSFGGYYWLIVTAIYLLLSFLTQAWDKTWMIWPAAAILYAVFAAIFKSLRGVRHS